MEEWLKQLGTWFTNATLGAANADAPAVTAASGWNRNSDGSWDLSLIDSDGAKNLRETLSVLSGLSEGADILPLVKTTYNFFRNPLKNIKLVKRTVKESKEYLDKYLKALGKPRIKGTFTGNRSTTTKAFAEYLESIGVDSSYFTEQDLRELMARRKASVDYTKPKGKSASVSEIRMGKNNVPTLESTIYEDGKAIGDISGFINHKDGDFMVSLVRKTDSNTHGVSEAAYNSILTYGHQSPNINFLGIRTGDELISPEMTYKVWEKYPDKKLIGNTGEHIFGRGRDVVNPTSKTTIQNGPVFRLTSPSYSIPTKHENIFHPDIINPDGTLRLPFWKNPDIYKSLIPLTILGNVFGNTNNRSNN